MKVICTIAACVLFAALSFTQPALPAEQQLQITSPKANATVSGEVIELAGTGADPSGGLEVEVLTNQWWPQDGVGRINPDGSWSYSPVYLSGKGSFNNHAIRVTQIKDHHRGKSTIVAGIVRKQ
jgi:hypothetical protein